MSEVLSIDEQNTSDSGGEAALLALRQSLVLYCTALTGGGPNAEDVAQDTLAKALPVIVGQVRHPNVKAYLFQVAKHVWIDQLKKRRTEAKYQPILMSSAEQPAEIGWEGLMLEDSVRLLLRELTARQRSVLLLRDVFDYSTTEVASMLDITDVAVKGALHRARQRLAAARHGGRDEAGEAAVQKEILAAYTAAIRKGDITAIVSLALADAVDPIHATVQLVNHTVQRRRSHGTTMLMMAA